MAPLDLVNNAAAARVAEIVNRDWGERVCTRHDVVAVCHGDYTDVGAAVESRIMQQLEEEGFNL